MTNYFNTLPLRRQLMQLGKCQFMDRSNFSKGVEYIRDFNIVVLGCGAQGLNQALCLKDNGLKISVALRTQAIAEKRQSWQNARDNKLPVGTIEELVPAADLVINLTPDKQHSTVIEQIMPLMKPEACLSYSHGFNIVEEGQVIRDDLSVIMVAPKGPGTEVRQEFLRGFGVPTLIAVHEENDPRGDGLQIASAYAAGIGAHRAGVLHSSFVAELKSDLMGEQTILCGMLQSGSLLCFRRMVDLGLPADYAAALVQYGWEIIGESLKHGGLTHMMNRLDNASKIRAFELAEQLRQRLQLLYEHHMDDILSGRFSSEMMADWADNDRKMLNWRAEIAATDFENTEGVARENIPEQEFFDHGILMVAMVKAGVELAFDTMLDSGMKAESAYYESLHELPLIANLIARKKLHEMNRVISDTAEYGCHLFNEACLPLLQPFVNDLDSDVIGAGLKDADIIDNRKLIEVNQTIAEHPVEVIGRELRQHMTTMKSII